MPESLLSAPAAPQAPLSALPPAHPVIGVFDSGVGGLSVLGALRRRQPAAALHYVADSGHAPYGDRDAAHVVDRSLRVAEHLVRHGADTIVVACNTATAWAIEALREQHPGVTLVGVEPGVKPAAALSRNRRIAVMATPGTLASQRFATLQARHAGDCSVIPMPCPGLAAAIERGEAATDEIDALLDRFCAPLRQADVDTVVLGCTHYPFVAERIAQRLGPDVQLLDTGDAVARHALNLWAARHPEAQAEDASTHIRLQSTGHAEVLARLARQGLGLPGPVETLTL